jgi:hypothetical protein
MRYGLGRSLTLKTWTAQLGRENVATALVLPAFSVLSEARTGANC